VLIKLKQLETELATLLGQEKNLNESSYERAGELTSVRNQIHEIEVRRSSVQTSLDVNSVEKSKTTEKKELFSSKLSKQQTGEEVLQSQLKDAAGAYEAANSQLQEVTDSLRQARGDRESLLESSQELTARLKVMEELRVECLKQDGIGEEAREEILKNESMRFLFDEISIEPGFENVVETALGAGLRSLVLERTGDLAGIKTIIDRKDFTKLSVLFKEDPIEGQGVYLSDDLKSQLHSVESIVKPSPAVIKLVQALFSGTYFLKNSMSAEEFIALSKHHPSLRLIDQSGVIFGPGAQITYLGEGHSIFSSKSEQVSLQSEFTGASEQLEIKTKELNDLEAHLEQVQITRDKQQGTLTQSQHSAEAAIKDINETNTQLTELGQIEDLLGSERTHLTTELNELDEKSQDLNRKITLLETQESEQQAAFSGLRQSIQTSKSDVESVFRQKQEKELARNTLAEKITFNEDSIKSLEKQKTDGAKTKVRYNQLIAENKEKSQAARSHNEQLDQELENLRETLQQDELALRSLEAERVDIQNRKRHSTEELNTEEKALEDCRQESHKIDMETQEMKHLISREAERLLQTYKITLSEHSKTDEELDTINLEELDAEISTLQEKVGNVGTVNLLAVEEYEELKQRFDFLDNQRQDLEKAKEELLQAIRKINRTTRKLFRDTFEAVRVNFAEYFKVLFEGGQAELIIIDEENPLDSGIDIFVRPPGKKTQNISLLSGGEKALTAIALLYALFKIKPSPFSVLDEIDAPLDEANIDRFLEVLDKFTQNSQFIIVTHNRKTISMGSDIFGVTMQEAGISKVVSVKLQDQEHEALKKSATEQSLSKEHTVS